MFDRPHHQRIEKLLDCFNSELLLQAECYFGGGTAIVLSLGEYWESIDVDLAMMIAHWGAIPEPAWAKVRDAYGKSADTAYSAAVALISDRNYLTSCLAKMHMDLSLVERIHSILGSAQIPSN